MVTVVLAFGGWRDAAGGRDFVLVIVLLDACVGREECLVLVFGGMRLFVLFCEVPYLPDESLPEGLPRCLVEDGPLLAEKLRPVATGKVPLRLGGSDDESDEACALERPLVLVFNVVESDGLESVAVDNDDGSCCDGKSGDTRG